MKLVLFSSMDGVARGWYIGPLVKVDREYALPFMPIEQNAPAPIAISQAFQIAREASLPITIIDPDRLWDKVWQDEEPSA